MNDDDKDSVDEIVELIESRREPGGRLGEREPPSDAFGDRIGQWVLNGLGVVGLLLLLSFALPLIFEEGKLTNIFDSTGEIITEATVDCEELQANLFLDFQCRSDPGCTMTRTELAAFEERAEVFGKYCEDGNE